MNPISTSQHSMTQLVRLARQAERRMRFNHAFRYAITVLSIALFCAVILLIFAKLNWVSDRRIRVGFYALTALPIVAFLWGWARKLPAWAGAMALDQQANLHDRLTTALSFYEQKEQTPLMQAAIADGLKHSGDANVQKAVPIRISHNWVTVLGLSVVLAMVSRLEVRKPIKALPNEQSAKFNPLEVDPEDLEPTSEAIKELEHATQSLETKEAAQEFNRILEEIKDKRIERNEAFRRMAALDTKLQKQSELDRKALEDALKKLGNELKKSELTKEIGASLEKGDKKEAEKKLRELASQLRNKDAKLSEEQKQKLADVLKKAASRDREKLLSEIKSKRDQVTSELERMRNERKKNQDKETSEQERDRKNKERELERLDREEQEQRSADRQLERLDRELSQAAHDVLKELGLSAKDLESGAHDLNRMAQDQLTQQEKEELRQRLKELRDFLVQQGKLSPDQIAKLKEFMKKARGGKQARKGRKPAGGQGPGKFDPNGDPSKGGQEQGDEEGDGKDGKGKEKTWTLGPDGKPIPMPGSGMSGAGNQPGKSPSGQGDQPGGQKWGVGHDPKVLGRKTANKTNTSDTYVSGIDTGQGPKRSETIMGAADRGFVGKHYKDVYGEYKNVAEETLKQDEIPAGYRFYVRRYFDLIRPRE